MTQPSAPLVSMFHSKQFQVWINIVFILIPLPPRISHRCHPRGELPQALQHLGIGLRARIGVAWMQRGSHAEGREHLTRIHDADAVDPVGVVRAQEHGEAHAQRSGQPKLGPQVSAVVALHETTCFEYVFVDLNS